MEMNAVFALILGVVGLWIGMLLNVAAVRALKRKSLADSPFLCVHCEMMFQPINRIPVFGYLAQKGRCRFCGKRISAAHPAGEAATAAVFAFIGYHYGPQQLEWIAAVLLASVLMIVTQTDLKAMLIPDRIVFPGAALAALLRLWQHPLPYWDYMLGAAFGFFILLVLAILSRGGMGGGDIKLYLFIGLLLGWKLTLLSLFAASVLGTIGGLLSLFLRRSASKQPIPFGPYIAVSAFSAFVYGDYYLAWYFRSVSL